jgi:NodT family efflux transporter outer membrane factor (OMF) lipoprotein
MTAYRAAFGAAALLLAGCVLPPDDPPQQAMLSAERQGLSATPVPVVVEAWWQAYGDAQLNRLMTQALSGNPSLALALARLRLAQSARAGADAGLLPHVTLDATETRQRFSANDVYPPPLAGNTYWQGGLKGDLSWNLDFWGRQAALVAQAEAQSQAAGLDVAAARLALIGGVAQAYLDLAHAYAVADLAVRTEAQRQHILELTTQRVASGLDTEVERRQADGAVAEARVVREAAENDKARAVHQLAALAGAGADAYPQIRRPSLKADSVLPLPAALPADLLARRPDLVAARARVDAALAGRRAADAAFYPDVDLVAFAGLSAIGLVPLFQGSSLTAGAGPALHLPLFDAGTLAAQFRGATAGLDAAVADYNRLVLQAVQDVADRLSEIAALKQERGHQRRQLEDAEAAFRLAEARYGAGLAGYLSVLNAETQLLSARRQDIDLATAEVFAKIRLLLAAGGSFTPAVREIKP